jgi:DNA-binding MarR family transcriptional regulator
LFQASKGTRAPDPAAVGEEGRAPNCRSRQRLTDKGRATLARAKKLVASKHEARLIEVLGRADHAALLAMLAKITQDF